MMLEQDHPIGFLLQLSQRARRRDRHRQNQSLGLLSADPSQCSPHRGARGNAVIDKDDDTPVQGDAGATPEIEEPSALNLGDLLVPSACELRFRDTCRRNNMLILNNERHRSVDDGSHCEFRIEWHADFANQDNVERSAKSTRDLGRDWYAPLGKASTTGRCLRKL
jgi:hypothetical protein